MSEWPEVTLNEVAEIDFGYPFKSQDYTLNKNNHRLLRGDNIVQGSLRWEGAKYWDLKAQTLDAYQLQEGDVVLAMDRPWIEAGLKYSSISKYDLPSLLVQRVARIRPRVNSDARFLKFLIGSQQFTDYVLSIQTGTAVPHISGSQIKDYTFTLPPLPVQRQIAAILSAFDDKIELNQHMNRTLEQMARALFKSWFVDFDPVRAKMRGEVPEGMDAETATLFPDELVEVEGREVPRGWRQQTVDQLYKLHGGSTPSTSNPDYWEGGEYNWSSPKDMSGLDVPFLTRTDKKITEAGTRVISSGILPSGTLLLSSRAPVGYMAIADMPISINQGYIAFEFTGVLERYFTLNLLQSRIDEIKAMASGTTFPELSKKTFRQFEVVVPTASIATAFEVVVESLYKKIQELIYESVRLDQIRDALLPRLLSGEVNTGEWQGEGWSP